MAYCQWRTYCCNLLCGEADFILTAVSIFSVWMLSSWLANRITRFGWWVVVVYCCIFFATRSSLSMEGRTFRPSDRTRKQPLRQVRTWKGVISTETSHALYVWGGYGGQACKTNNVNDKISVKWDQSQRSLFYCERR